MDSESPLFYALLVGFVVAIAGPILLIVGKAFRLHDPKRAQAAVPVEAGRAFELPLRLEIASELFFRFEIDGDTDDDYDLAAIGEIEDAAGNRRAFAVRTAKKTRIEAAAHAVWRGQTFAVTTSAGSILLSSLGPGDRWVRGRIEEHPARLLRSGWVYVPK